MLWVLRGYDTIEIISVVRVYVDTQIREFFALCQEPFTGAAFPSLTVFFSRGVEEKRKVLVRK